MRKTTLRNPLPLARFLSGGALRGVVAGRGLDILGVSTAPGAAGLGVDDSACGWRREGARKPTAREPGTPGFRIPSGGVVIGVLYEGREGGMMHWGNIGRDNYKTMEEPKKRDGLDFEFWL